MTLERKELLFDEMLSYLCEIISNEEDLFITLHNHFGMSKEELNENGIDYLDELFEETDEERTRPDGISPHDFIEKVSEMVNGDDKSAVLNWVDYASCMSEGYGGDRTTLEKELCEVYLPICFVKNNFSDFVLQRTLNMESMGSEVIYGAMLHAAGYGKDEILNLSYGDILLDGYIPFSDDEIGTLSVVSIAGRDDILLIAESGDAKKVATEVGNAVDKIADSDMEIENVLTDSSLSGIPFKAITNPKLIDAIKISCTASTAFSNITVSNPNTNEVTQYPTEGMTVEQRNAIFSGSDGVGMTPQM